MTNEELLERYPFLKTDEEDKTWLDHMWDGWRKLFGIQLCEDLKEAIEHDHIQNFKIITLKEKFGKLRLICHGGNGKDKIWEIKTAYEYISSRTCIECGKFPVHMYDSDGYICPHCKEHKPKYARIRDNSPAVDELKWTVECLGEKNDYYIDLRPYYKKLGIR